MGSDICLEKQYDTLSEQLTVTLAGVTRVIDAQLEECESDSGSTTLSQGVGCCTTRKLTSGPLGSGGLPWQKQHEESTHSR